MHLLFGAIAQSALSSEPVCDCCWVWALHGAALCTERCASGFAVFPPALNSELGGVGGGGITGGSDTQEGSAGAK